MSTQFELPEAFTQTITEVAGAPGTLWLRDLPDLIGRCAERWALHIGPPFDLSYNYVLAATRADGAPAVLKLFFPGGDEFGPQIEALRLYEGRGASRLLEVEGDDRVALLERVEPGTPLTSLSLADDEGVTVIAAEVMRRLWRPLPPDHSFHTVVGLGAAFSRLRDTFNGTSGPLPPDLFARGESLFAELSTSMAEPVLLHGDLHHDNILSGRREPWLAIDPKGIAGEPAYEVGALLHNPWNLLLEMPNPRKVLRRRIDLLASELSIDRARIHGWGLAVAVLSAVWVVEDHGHGRDFAIRVAELLAEIG